MLLTPRDRPGRPQRFRDVAVFGGGVGAGGSVGGAAVLSSPNAGTPTSDGTTGASVSSTGGPGQLYWAVVTNGGSATNAQILAGTGGNIVPGEAGNQPVSGAGTQTIATITGLTTATTYQILFLQVSPGGAQSNQASVSLTTA